MTEKRMATIRPIHYLGSKLRMLDTIKEAIDKVDPTGGEICDLFSGSGTVTKYMTEFRDVTSVDIQHYSSVLCEASSVRIPGGINATSVVERIKTAPIHLKLRQVFSSLIELEREALDDAAKGLIDDEYEIIENGSIYIYLVSPEEGVSAKLNKALRSTAEQLRKSELHSTEDTMITRYYGGLYFSYEQAVDLDSIASYVFQCQGILKTKLLAALLSTTSEIVNTVGKQFAQPLKVRNSSGELKSSLRNKIVQDRSLDVFTIFLDWVSYYSETGTDTHRLTSWCIDYGKALQIIDPGTIKAVYADPPYTRYHYSRYYHVLETICLRDNPRITTTFPNGQGGISRAIYREGRHQSPFCIKSQAEHAFDVMFAGVSKLRLPLVLSYSPFDASKAVTPRLRTIDQLMNMAKHYYEDVSVLSPGIFTHSKLNSIDKNHEANHEAELLIICRGAI